VKREPNWDVVIVGAGIGGIYGVNRLRSCGLSVLGIERAPEVGGVWYHNAYPGARVDLESHYYCYLFDEDLYREWAWSERYAAQPELLRYLNHVADRLDVRRDILFGTSVTASRWEEDGRRWVVETDTHGVITARFPPIRAPTSKRTRSWPMLPGIRPPLRRRGRRRLPRLRPALSGSQGAVR
jgi:cation diffusion facilitator CzcD-associated flavoprotein CzcO